jgi:hypothetical protein
MKRLAHTWRGNLLLSVCFFFTARSFPSPLSLGFFALDPTPQTKKKIQSGAERNFILMRLYYNRRRKEGSLTRTFG